MIPNDVRYIIETLNKHDFEAFIVGGAVRNTYLNLPVNDWDITTNALPEDIESLFEHTYCVGKAFGTIIIRLDEHYEVTTYRTESDYDGRKPGHVSFSSSIIEDLKRRDFTMNAMIMNLSGEITDYFDGKRDLDVHMIHTVGPGKERFREDYLRVYRYVRFTAQYKLIRNPDLDQTIREMAINKIISFERIREEFNKILLSDQPSNGIKHLEELGLLSYIMPEIIPTIGFDQHSKFHHLTVYQHLLKALDNSPTNLSIRLAALCHDIGKPSTFELIDGEGHFYGHDKASVVIAETFLRRMKYPNKMIEEILLLIKNHMRLLNLSNTKSVKKFINKLGVENLDGYLSLRKADILSSTTNDTLESVSLMREKFNDIINEQSPMSINDLDINGHDLIALGYIGIEIGQIKKMLLDLILEEPELNKKESLIIHLKELDIKQSR